MLWDLLDNKEKANVLIKILYLLARSDGRMSEQEFAYLIHVCKTLHVDPEEIRNFNLDDGEINEILPIDEQDRMQVLYHLLFMMEADKLVDPEEEKVLYHFGHKLGFSELMVQDFVEVFKRHDIDDLPPHTMIDIIRKYQN